MKNGKKKKSAFWKAVMWLALLGLACCLGFLGWYFWSTYQTEKEYEALRSQMETEQETAPEYTLEEIQNAEFTGIIEVDVPAPEIPEGVLLEAENQPVDFEKLKELNPELYAWIRIPNTEIDYPVAQHEGDDQEFYLHHDMYQDPQFAGCIYTENGNSKDFSDPVTVLYGHNMKNGTMFQNLFRFQESSFFEENKYIYVYTENRILVYEVFAAYPYDDRHILTSFDFSDEEVLEEYLENCQHPHSMEAMVREDVEVTKDTPIITLSTCIADQTDQRYLVQAVLRYEENGE